MLRSFFALFLVLCLTFSVYAKSDAFSFVVIGDTRPDKFIQSQKAFYEHIDNINNINPDFVINVGDLIYGYTSDTSKIYRMWENYEKDIAKIKPPYWHVVGNHDVWNLQSKAIWDNKFGAEWYTKEHKNCFFIMLSSEDVSEKIGMIVGKQKEWLADQLEKGKKYDHVFISMHKPLWDEVNTNWNNEIHPMLKAAGNVRAVFVGHWHTYAFYPEKDGIKYIVTGGGGARLDGTEWDGGFYHFLKVDVTVNDIKVKVHKGNQIVDENIVSIETIRHSEDWRK